MEKYCQDKGFILDIVNSFSQYKKYDEKVKGKSKAGPTVGRLEKNR